MPPDILDNSGAEIILLDRTEQGGFSDSSGNVYVPV
jgi:hypothetical protein